MQVFLSIIIIILLKKFQTILLIKEGVCDVHLEIIYDYGPKIKPQTLQRIFASYKFAGIYILITQIIQEYLEDRSSLGKGGGVHTKFLKFNSRQCFINLRDKALSDLLFYLFRTLNFDSYPMKRPTSMAKIIWSQAAIVIQFFVHCDNKNKTS